MNRSLRPAVMMALFFFALAGCSGARPEAPAAAVRAVGDVFVRADLQRVGTGPNVGGVVRVIDLPGTDDLEVQVEATGIPAGPHAWHIHSGTCAQVGAIVVAFTTVGQNQGIDEPIEAGADGRAAEDATIPSRLMTRERLTATPHALQIHAGAGMPPGAGIACADLR